MSFCMDFHVFSSFLMAASRHFICFFLRYVRYMEFFFRLSYGHWWCLWHFLTQESECESRDGGWTALAKGPADYRTGHSLFCLAAVFLPFCRLPSVRQESAQMLAVRGLSLHKPPLQQLGKKIFQRKFLSNSNVTFLLETAIVPLVQTHVGENHLGLSRSASWFSACYCATVLPAFGVGAMVDQTRFLKGTNPFILQVIQIYSYIQHVYYIHINMYIYIYAYIPTQN